MTTLSSSDRLALDLRLRFLESILSPAPTASSSSSSPSLSRRLAALNESIDGAISAQSSTEAIRRFVRSCECAHMVRPC